VNVGSAVYRFGPQIWIFDFSSALPQGESIAEVISGSVVNIGPQGGGVVASSGGITSSPATNVPLKAADFVILISGAQSNIAVNVNVLVLYNFTYLTDDNGNFVIDDNGNYVITGRNVPPVESTLTMVASLQGAPNLPWFTP
jgi:hypothetical protein